MDKKPQPRELIHSLHTLEHSETKQCKSRWQNKMKNGKEMRESQAEINGSEKLKC
jgi:hypothetical protein